jgi:glutamate/tyrosine decarboxylase-like PLP-dependent enzyme
MYNSKHYIKHQYFICEDYCGSIYATSSLLGNRSGSTIAITWGNIVTKGFNYYKHRANSIISNTEILASRIGNIDHIRIVNTEFINVVVFTSDVYDITYLYQKLDHLEVEFIHDSLHLFTTTITSNRDTIIDIIKSNLIEKTLSSETPMLRRSMKSVAYNYLDTLFT